MDVINIFCNINDAITNCLFNKLVTQSDIKNTYKKYLIVFDYDKNMGFYENNLQQNVIKNMQRIRLQIIQINMCLLRVKGVR